VCQMRRTSWYAHSMCLGPRRPAVCLVSYCWPHFRPPARSRFQGRGIQNPHRRAPLRQFGEPQIRAVEQTLYSFLPSKNSHNEMKCIISNDVHPNDCAGLTGRSSICCFSRLLSALVVGSGDFWMRTFISPVFVLISKDCRSMSIAH